MIFVSMYCSIVLRMIPDTEHYITRIRILITMFLDYSQINNKMFFLLLSHFDVKVMDNRERETNSEYTECIYLIKKIMTRKNPQTNQTHTQDKRKEEETHLLS